MSFNKWHPEMLKLPSHSEQLTCPFHFNKRNAASDARNATSNEHRHQMVHLFLHESVFHIEFCHFSSCANSLGKPEME